MTWHDDSGTDERRKVDKMMFVQVSFKVVQQQCNERKNDKFVNGQLNSCQSIEKFGDCALEGMTQEPMHLNLCDGFILCMKDSVTKEDWKKICETVNSTKEKDRRNAQGEIDPDFCSF